MKYSSCIKIVYNNNNNNSLVILPCLVYVDQLVKRSVITLAYQFWIRYQHFFMAYLVNFQGNTFILKIRDIRYNSLCCAKNYQGLGINFLWSSELNQGLGRLWYHFCDESNSEQRSTETVYMCSINGFELLFVWWLWVLKPYKTVFFLCSVETF